MQDYTKFGAWGFLQIDEEMYLVSHCHLKKVAVKFYIFFFNKYSFLFNFFICDFFLIKKTKKL